MDPSNRQSIRKSILKKKGHMPQGPSIVPPEGQLVEPTFVVAPGPEGTIVATPLEALPPQLPSTIAPRRSRPPLPIGLWLLRGLSMILRSRFVLSIVGR